jgi:hypothetical protein
MDHLGLVEAVDGFGESIVIGISDAADRRLDACSARRSVYLIDTYWADSNGRRNIDSVHSW